MVTQFYKGVSPGTHLHSHDLRATGILPRRPHMPHDIVAVEQHIAYGTTTSPYVSLTRSYGVAQNYARDAYLTAPAPASPGYVYELRIPDLPKGRLIDPIAFIASHHANPLTSSPYHHDGDQDFLAFVASPIFFPFALGPAPRPPWAAPGTSPPQPTLTFSAIAFALRDAEILVNGNIPASWVVDRFDVY